MKLIVRLFLVLIIAAAGASVYKGMQMKEEKKKLDADLTSTKEAKQKVEGKLSAEEKQHNDTKSKLTGKEGELKVALDEKSKAQADASAKAAQAKEAESKLEGANEQAKKAQADFNKLKSELPSDVAPGEIKGKFKEFQENFAVLSQEKNVLNEQLNKMAGEIEQLKKKPEDKVAAAQGIRGRVAAVSEEWNFVVLDIGKENGMPESAEMKAEMIVYRDGNLVGKVRVNKVEASQTIADILPNWKKDAIREGDMVIF